MEHRFKRLSGTGWLVACAAFGFLLYYCLSGFASPLAGAAGLAAMASLLLWGRLSRATKGSALVASSPSEIVPAGFDRRKFILGLAAGGALVARPSTAHAAPENVAANPMGISVRDYGAVGDGKTDDTVAFQSWALAMKQAGNTLGWIPAGTYRITQTISFNDAGPDTDLLYRSVLIRGTGSGSRILLALGAKGIGFTFGNMENGAIEDLIFIGDGSNTGSYDCGTALGLFSCLRFRLRGVGFVGVGYGDNAVLSSGGGLIVESCYFRGTGGMGEALKIDSWTNLSVTLTDFIDYGFLDGGYLSKVGSSTFLPRAWIFIGASPGSIESLLISDCQFDENGYQGIRIDPGAGRIERASVLRCCGSLGYFDFSGYPSLSYGEPRAFLRARNVDKLLVDSCWAGYSAALHDAIRVSGCGSVAIHHLVATQYAPQGATRIIADNTTEYVEVRESDYGTIASDAALTRVQKRGVWARMVRTDGPVSANTLATISPSNTNRITLASAGVSPSEVVGVVLDDATDGSYTRIAESGQVVSVMCDGVAVVPADAIVPSLTSDGRASCATSAPQIGRALSPSAGVDSLITIRFFHA